jgi:regulator of chromosome condensation
LSVDGTLFTFGCGSDGRLGHPEYLGSVYLYKESHPKEVEYFAKKGLKVDDVTASYYQMLSVVSSK